MDRTLVVRMHDFRLSMLLLVVLFHYRFQVTMASRVAGWEDKRLDGDCGCHQCLLGLASHNDTSHDQSLRSSFELRNDFTQRPIKIRGGTTKCARVLVDYFQRNQEEFDIQDKKVVEVGSGTGLVGIALARLSARQVVLTDQLPVLDICQDSINNNFSKEELRNHRIYVKDLYW